MKFAPMSDHGIKLFSFFFFFKQEQITCHWPGHSVLIYLLTEEHLGFIHVVTTMNISAIHI